MPFSVVSATTRADLLAAIATFAVANGWTAEYNVTGELALSKSNCHVALSDGGTVSRNDLVNGGTVTDGLIYGALGTSITSGNHHYYGHPGSVVANSSDTDRVTVNDLAGPFTNVYLFTDSASASTYIHCVVQSASDRYTQFSFGNVDKIGFSHSDIGFLVGTYFQWWPDNASVSSSSYGPNNINGSHSIGLFGGNFNEYIPSGVLDTSLGFPSGAHMLGAISSDTIAQTLSLNQQWFTGIVTGRVLDHFHLIDNDTTTGGAPLWPIPNMFDLSGHSIRCMLGMWPDICLFNLNGFSAAEVVAYGGDNWQIFPVKTFGTHANANRGSNPMQYVNTENFAFAIKQIS